MCASLSAFPVEIDETAQKIQFSIFKNNLGLQ
jgi:hypothetical protein